MLIRFNVKNFLSFSAREDGKSEEFSMLAGKMRSKEAHILATDKIKLLKFSAIYGANAAGKSNLVKAMSFMQQAVVRRLSERFADKYCKNDAANKDKPSYFEMEIMLGEHYYAYGFEVILSRLQFVSEWLFLLDVDQDELIFERNITAGTYELGECFKKNAKLHEKLDIYAGDIRDDGSTLFLRVMNQNKKNFYQENGDAQVLRQIYSWIKAGLDITYPDQPVSDYSYLTASNDVGELCRVISAFGTGITDFKILDVPIERVVSKLPLPLREKIESTIEEGCRQVKR